MLLAAEKSDLLGEREDHMLELKPFRLVDGHYPDRLRVGRRTDLGISLLPGLQESIYGIPVDGDIILHEIHQRLGVLGLRLKQFRIPILKDAQELLTKIGQRQA